MSYKCGKCGNEVSDDTSFCPKCGTKIDKTNPALGCVGILVLGAIYLVVEYWRYVVPIVAVLIVGVIYYLLTKDKKDKPGTTAAKNNPTEIAKADHQVQDSPSANEDAIDTDEDMSTDDGCYQKARDASERLYAAVAELNDEWDVISNVGTLEALLGTLDIDGESPYALDAHIWTAFLVDVAFAYKTVGCDPSNLGNNNGLAYLYLMNRGLNSFDEDTFHAELRGNVELISACEKNCLATGEHGDAGLYFAPIPRANM